MNLPGFSAETSLRRMVLAYNVAWQFDELGNVVRPQTCDQACLDACNLTCPDPGDCPDDPPDLRAQCLKDVRVCRNQCRTQCCTICNVTCGPCTGGSCNAYPSCGPVPGSGTQTCTDCNGNISTQSC